MYKIAVINGPNLNLLGEREPEIYGTKTLDEICQGLSQAYPEIEFDFFQSNIEGELIDFIQQRRHSVHAFIFNPAGYSHTSYAIADTLAVVSCPVIEVHLSNIHSRDRSHSITGAQSKAVITGLGHWGYHVAVEAVKRLII